jgi:UDP-N-acetyl-2-amino-2-deoxyglucuronate dehydrogenase
VHNFALTGLAGYIAPRHLEAIKKTGSRLVAAMDPHDSVGIVDSYFPDAAFFTEFERFDRHLERLRRGREQDRVEYLSICSPNHLHDAHVRLALRIGATAICEKPLVLNPWNLDALADIERESPARVFTVLQLRLQPALIELRNRIRAEQSRRHSVRMTYVTSRGAWYRYSWKGDPSRSGGMATNIGIHLFDLLVWIFGAARRSDVHLAEPERIGGVIELENADVQWFLSIDARDLPSEIQGVQRTFRSIAVDGEEIEFSGGFNDLHTRVYEETLAGRGFGIEEARPSVELIHRIREASPREARGEIHPMIRGSAQRTRAALKA